MLGRASCKSNAFLPSVAPTVGIYPKKCFEVCDEKFYVVAIISIGFNVLAGYCCDSVFLVMERA